MARLSVFRTATERLLDLKHGRTSAEADLLALLAHIDRHNAALNAIEFLCVCCGSARAGLHR